jgi:hypothetical protein
MSQSIRPTFRLSTAPYWTVARRRGPLLCLLLGAALATLVPSTASADSAPAASKAAPASLSGAAGSMPMQIGPSCSCQIQETCDPKIYGTCHFVKQKTNGVCVYCCNYTQACTFTNCNCSQSSFSAIGCDNFKTGPYKQEACPPNPDFLSLTPGS